VPAHQTHRLAWLTKHSLAGERGGKFRLAGLQKSFSISGWGSATACGVEVFRPWARPHRSAHWRADDAAINVGCGMHAHWSHLRQAVLASGRPEGFAFDAMRACLAVDGRGPGVVVGGDQISSLGWGPAGSRPACADNRLGATVMSNLRLFRAVWQGPWRPTRSHRRRRPACPTPP